MQFNCHLKESNQLVEKLSQQEFRTVFSKTIKKCEHNKLIEDTLVQLLSDEKGEIYYISLCKLLDFYNYHFMSQRPKPDYVKEYNPITNLLKEKPGNPILVKDEERQGIEDTLSYFWTKIGEKFSKLTKVFRFFDL